MEGLPLAQTSPGTGTATPTPAPTSTPGSGSTATPSPPTASPLTDASGSSPLGELLPDVLQFPGWEILAILAVLALGVTFSKYVTRLLGRPVARRFRRQSVAQTVLRIIRLTFVLLAAVFGARLVGVQLTNIVLSVTVFSAVLGIVLAPIVGSIINGFFLLADEPYEIGDMIELDDGTRGFVDDITLRYTKIFTLDNTFLVIPNSTIRDRDVTNFSAEDERIRLSLTVLVTYESNVAQARRLMERAAASVDAVVPGGPDIRIGSARYPASPRAYIDQYGDHGINLRLRYWAKKPYKPGTVRSQVLTNLWDLLEEEGPDVEMAYPHSHLYFDETSGSMNVSLRETPEDAPTGSGPGRPTLDDRPGDVAAGGRVTPQTAHSLGSDTDERPGNADDAEDTDTPAGRTDPSSDGVRDDSGGDEASDERNGDERDGDETGEDDGDETSADDGDETSADDGDDPRPWR